jgi:hypothetical protein
VATRATSTDDFDGLRSFVQIQSSGPIAGWVPPLLRSAEGLLDPNASAR